MKPRIFNVKHTAVALIALVLAGTSTMAQRKDDAEVLLQRAIQKEMVEGDLKSAIEIYKKVLATKGVRPDIAAEALMRMGSSYERLNDADAKKSYQRIQAEFSQEKALASEANRRLAMITAKESPVPTMRFVCKGCVNEESSVTTDGRYLLTTEFDTEDALIRDLVTGESKRLMAKAGGSENFVQSPVMSPDRKRVVYNWFAGDLAGAAPFELRLMNTAPGSKPAVLVSNPDYVLFRPEGWSLDGKSILTTVWKLDGTHEFIWVSAADGAVKRIKSLEFRLNSVTSRPRLSPDGQRIVYSALAVNPPGSRPRLVAVRDQHVYVIPADGSGPETALVKGANANEFPVWSSDGARVFFVSNRSNSWALWSVGVQNGQVSGFPRLERPDTGRILPIGMSHSGSLYYAQIKPTFEQIFIGEVRRGGAGSTPIASGDSTLGGQSPGWSPDGKMLAFARLRAGTSNVYDPVVRVVETGEERTFSHDRFAAGYEMRWFNDSRSFLAWVREPSTPPNLRVLYRVNIETRQWEPLATLDISAMAPATGISSDNQLLFKGARDPKNAELSPPPTNRPFDRILTLDLKTGKEKQALPLPEPAYTFRLSPDGKTFMLYAQPDPKKTEFYVARMDVDGSNYRRLAGPFELAGASWTGDSRAIVLGVIEKAGGPGTLATSRIMRLPAEGGQLTYMGVTITGLNALAMNVDGSHIAYSATTLASGEVWALDNLSSFPTNAQ
jgi:Tol biopolymer transport system component